MSAERLELRCAAESLARNEPLVATASRVQRWILVEQPGPWGRDAVLESRLDATFARTLSERAHDAGARVVLIRHPARVEPTEPRAYLVRSAPTGRWIEQLTVDALPDVDLDLLRFDDRPHVGTPGPASVNLVCTNGKHDPCCADFGRPVVRALRDAGVPEVWESSHVGGDRFAANLVVLPTGVYYGRVPPDRAAELVADHDRGLLHLDLYRGRCCYPPMLQAAEIFLRHAVEERRLDAVRVGASKRIGDDQRAVVVHASDDAFVITVERERSDAVQLTCTASGPLRPWCYRLVDLRPGATP